MICSTIPKFTNESELFNYTIDNIPKERENRYNA